MIENVRSDPIVSFLLQKSSMTSAQLDTIMAAQIDGKLDQKILLREKKEITKGSFVRTLRQSRNNIESSIYTLMLVVYLELVPQEKFEQYVRTLRLFSRVKGAEPDRESTMRLINGMQEFAEEFSGRSRKLLL